MYDAILYPTDGSEAAGAALEHARKQADQYGATIHVLYVIDMEHAGTGLAGDVASGDSTGMVGTPSGSGTGMVGTRDLDEEDDDLKSEGRELTEQVADQFGDVETETAVRAGVPYEAILDYVDEVGIDMIVMSTHGRSGLERYMIGSVTEKVVRFADVPVLTVRASDD